MQTKKINIHWFRRDLRLADNASLYHALKSKNPVLCIFIFDTSILNKLSNKEDARVQFILQEVNRLSAELKAVGSDLIVKIGEPINAWKEVIQEYSVDHVFTNNDYEPYALERDKQIEEMLAISNIGFSSFKDQVIFEKSEIVKDDGTPYTVFTPYSRKWKTALNDFYLKPYPSEAKLDNLLKISGLPIVELIDLNFKPTKQSFPPREINTGLIKNYEFKRDLPGVEGTSRLSLHFRFGTISVRSKVRKAMDISEKWLNELIWREFYMSILFHFPNVVTQSFKPNYDRIEWRNDQTHFEKWCQGKTGYPIVDAGMRQLNETGFMHNRVRMVVASFLTKHLLIDWRWGEAYFAEKLLDYELSSNNGGWQWAAGSGVDAAPYFRIFNPYLQTNKFDPQNIYIEQWVPEWNSSNYPKPIVNHEEARKLCLEVYKKALI